MCVACLPLVVLSVWLCPIVKWETNAGPGLGNCCWCWPGRRERAWLQRPGDLGDRRRGETGRGRGGLGCEASYPGVGTGVWRIFSSKFIKSIYFTPVISCVVLCQLSSVFFIWIYPRNIVLSEAEQEHFILRNLLLDLTKTMIAVPPEMLTRTQENSNS